MKAIHVSYFLQILFLRFYEPHNYNFFRIFKLRATLSKLLNVNSATTEHVAKKDNLRTNCVSYKQKANTNVNLDLEDVFFN